MDGWMDVITEFTLCLVGLFSSFVYMYSLSWIILRALLGALNPNMSSFGENYYIQRIAFLEPNRDNFRKSHLIRCGR